MRIDLPPELAEIVRQGNPTSQLIIFVNGQYMPPQLGYRYGVTSDAVVIKFEGLGATLEKLSEMAKTVPKLEALVSEAMIQVTIVQIGVAQWHYKDGKWEKM